MSRYHGVTDRSSCVECGQGAYGIHGDDCSKRNDDACGIPTYLQNPGPQESWSDCEWCVMHTPASEYCGRHGHRPVVDGDTLACTHCGNDAPRGTYRGTLHPYTGPVEGDLDNPKWTPNWVPPRAPEWRKVAA